MISRDNTKQFIKFAIVGVLSTMLNYSIFYILYTYSSINYIIASATGFIIGVFFGFFLNKNWTFSNDSKTDSFILKYFIVYTVSLVASLLFLKIAVDTYYIDARLANVLSIGFTTVINFLGTKLLVFKV